MQIFTKLNMVEAKLHKYYEKWQYDNFSNKIERQLLFAGKYVKIYIEKLHILTDSN